MSYNIYDSYYSLVEHEGKEFYGVRLHKEYEGVIIVYGTVSLKENMDDNTAKLKFTYLIEEASTYDTKNLESDREFNNHIGKILQHILEDSLNNRTGRIGKNVDEPEYTYIKSPLEQ